MRKRQPRTPINPRRLILIGIITALFYWSLHPPETVPQPALWALRLSMMTAILAHGVEGLGLLPMPAGAKIVSAIAALTLSGSALGMALAPLPNTTEKAALFIRAASVLMATLEITSSLMEIRPHK